MGERKEEGKRGGSFSRKEREEKRSRFEREKRSSTTSGRRQLGRDEEPSFDGLIHSFRKGGAPARNQNDDSGFGGGSLTPFGRGSYRGGGGGDARRSRGYFTSTPYRGSGGRRGHVTTPASGNAADFIAGKCEELEREVKELRAAKNVVTEAPAKKIRAGTLTEIEDLKRKLSKTRDTLERDKSKNEKCSSTTNLEALLTVVIRLRRIVAEEFSRILGQSLATVSARKSLNRLCSWYSSR